MQSYIWIKSIKKDQADSSLVKSDFRLALPAAGPEWCGSSQTGGMRRNTGGCTER